MGFISNQWLNRGQGLRRRSYRPVSVSLQFKRPRDSWSAGRQIACEFAATRPHNGQYQTVHLTRDETDTALEVMFGSASEPVRVRLVEAFLPELSDRRLLRLLALHLRKRIKLPKVR